MSNSLRNSKSRVLSTGLALFLLAGAAGCVSVEDYDPYMLPPDETPDDGGMPEPEPTGAVCDPLAQDSIVTAANGIRADLFELKGDLYASTARVSAAQATGTRRASTIYLSQLFVPAQNFDRGFHTADGVVLKRLDGTPLTSNFSLHMETRLTLAPENEPGQYQFALYSDDGSTLEIDSGSGLETIIDHDGLHDATLRVSTVPVTLNAGDEFPAVINYMQGPPFHIAAILLWRKWPSAADAALRPVLDPANGLGTNFWDYTQVPSVAYQPWNDLLARGWQVVAPENFLMPEDAPVNPCAETP